MVERVLVANRGEIARRIIRTCRRMGVSTVAVHSDADRDAPHVREADVGVRIGPAAATASYLDGTRLLAVAAETDCDAVHPGYGFLAENAEFARACHDRGLRFIGPSPDVIELMGDKAAAKRRMAAAGVPVVPGEDRDDLGDAELIAAAGAVGFPLLVKAVAGGGGKGMRTVANPANLPAAIAAARREATAAFGDGRVILERLITQSRHVEIQVFGDRSGHVIHLLERECSIQRRHQKLVEEAPSPALDPRLRARMGATAVTAAAEIGYEGAGTVEFLLDATTLDDERPAFFFLEMNTRLQVEHPVTEAVTGLDLVELQLRVADGEPLGIEQADVRADGHAIEVRLYAEDPVSHLPQTGRVVAFEVPGLEDATGAVPAGASRGAVAGASRGPVAGASRGPVAGASLGASGDVRLDSGVEAGSEVGPHYDPLLAKLIVHAPDREAACALLGQVLRDSSLRGVTTNLALLTAIAETPAFRQASLTTGFLGDHLGSWAPTPPGEDDLLAAVAALEAHRRARQPSTAEEPSASPWSRLGPVRPTGGGGWRLTLSTGTDGPSTGTDGLSTGTDHTAWVRTGPEGTVAVIDGGDVRPLPAPGRTDVVELPGGSRQVWTHGASGTHRLTVQPATRWVDAGIPPGRADFTAPMPGAVLAVEVAEGQRVAAGVTLIVIEAMKMEHPIVAPTAGTVLTLSVAAGQSVAAGATLLSFEPDA